MMTFLECAIVKLRVCACDTHPESPSDVAGCSSCCSPVFQCLTNVCMSGGSINSLYTAHRHNRNCGCIKYRNLGALAMQKVGNSLLTITSHTTATPVCDDTEYPLHDVITEFDCIFQMVTFSSWS
jgi:hypothetical protein